MHIDYKQLLDPNYMFGGLISYWAPFRVRRPRQLHLRDVLEIEGLPPWNRKDGVRPTDI